MRKLAKTKLSPKNFLAAASAIINIRHPYSTFTASTNTSASSKRQCFVCFRDLIISSHCYNHNTTVHITSHLTTLLGPRGPTSILNRHHAHQDSAAETARGGGRCTTFPTTRPDRRTTSKALSHKQLQCRRFITASYRFSTALVISTTIYISTSLYIKTGGQSHTARSSG